MPNLQKEELKKITRTVMEWMVDDYSTGDIINQSMTKWNLTEKEADNLLSKVRHEWGKNEKENNNQKRLRKIESLKKLKRGMSPEDRKTPHGIMALLNVEKELFRLESITNEKVTSAFNKLSKGIRLTARQERFCQEYTIDFNGTQAAIRAGFSKKTAASIASEYLRKPNIQKFIEILKEDLRKKTELDAAMVVQELRDLGEYNIQDFLLPGNQVKDLTTLPRKQTKAITGIKTREKYLPDGSREVVTELKFNDNRATWVDLGRHVGIFEKDNRQRAAKIKVTRK
jgi:phage terminase small subunit